MRLEVIIITKATIVSATLAIKNKKKHKLARSAPSDRALFAKSASAYSHSQSSSSLLSSPIYDDVVILLI